MRFGGCLAVAMGISMICQFPRWVPASDRLEEHQVSAGEIADPG